MHIECALLEIPRSCLPSEVGRYRPWIYVGLSLWSFTLAMLIPSSTQAFAKEDDSGGCLCGLRRLNPGAHAIRKRLAHAHRTSDTYLTVNLVLEPVSNAPVSRSQPRFLRALSCILRSVEDVAIERSNRVELSFSNFSATGLSC